MYMRSLLAELRMSDLLSRTTSIKRLPIGPVTGDTFFLYKVALQRKRICGCYRWLKIESLPFSCRHNLTRTTQSFHGWAFYRLQLLCFRSLGDLCPNFSCFGSSMASFVE